MFSMLKKRNGIKIAIWIVLLIDVVLLAVLFSLAIKWFLGYLEIKEISKIWPEGEFVILQCGLITFTIASVIFCVRMIYLDFMRQVYKAKVEEYECFGVKTEKESYETPEYKLAKKEKKLRNVPAPAPAADNSEVSRLKKELAAEKQWRRNAGELYPDIEDRVAEYIDSCPV